LSLDELREAALLDGESKQRRCEEDRQGGDPKSAK
jgi:hypothetical protein